MPDDESSSYLKNDHCPGNSGCHKKKDLSRGDVPDDIPFRGRGVPSQVDGVGGHFRRRNV